MPTTRALRWGVSAVAFLAVVLAAWLVVTTLAPRADGVPAVTSGAAGTPGVTPAPMPGVTPGPMPSVTPAPMPSVSEVDALAGVLGQDVPQALSGELVVAAGSEPPPGSGRVTRVRVEAEKGLPIDLDQFASFVMTTLNDVHGWGADGTVTFARTDGDADLRVLVASPATVDAMCAPLRTNSTWSCGRYGHAALNAERWVHGADAFNAASGDDLLTYRQYLVNHEVGHLLGHQHTSCPGPGQTAPVMLQQSITLDGCVPNGWPHP